MALDSITVTTTSEAGIVYEPTAISGAAVVRSDTAASLSEPRLLEISHQTGSKSKPDRHLVKFTQTEQSSSDPSQYATGSVHVVFTVPRDIITQAQVIELWKKQVALLTDGNIAAILRNAYL